MAGNAAGDSTEITVAAADITGASVSPKGTTLPGKGPGALNQNVVVSFSTTNAIPVGGKVIVTLSSFWAIKSDGICTYTGLEQTSGSCSRASLVATILNLKAVTAKTAITVTFTKAYPTNAAASGAGGKCAASITTKTKNDEEIDTVTNVDSCENVVATAVGKSTFGANAVLLHPNAAGRKADIHMTFSLTQALPSGGVITITSPLGVTTDTTSCYANFAFSSCTHSGNDLILTTSADITASQSLEVLADNAVTVGAAAGTGDFQVVTTWDSVKVTDDKTAAVVKTTVTYGVAGTDITSGTVTASVKTPGEYSSYTFTYTTPVGIAAEDVIWISFPHTYDPNIGIAFEESSGKHYIMCDSASFSGIKCRVDHWKVVITGLATVATNTQVSIRIRNILNPAALSAANFGFVHLDSTATTVKAADDTFASTGVDITGTPGHIPLRSVSNTSNKELTVASDYVFKFYVDFSVATSDAFMVTFPREFLLDVAHTSDLSCSAKFYDESTTSETTNEIDATKTTCTILKNFVSYTAGTLATAVDLDAHDRVELTLSSVENARWGQARNANGDGIVFYDVDSLAITNTLFTEYKTWSTKFDISLFDSSEKAIVHRSYQNMNSGYVGYADSTTERVSLIVDDWEADTGVGRILVIEGSQSDEREVQFSNGVPLIADTLTIAGSLTTSGTNVKLWVENSTTDWSYALLDDEVSFRVSAPAGTPAGYQYITWTISSETKESCHTTNIYGPGPRVLVEVIDMTSAVTISTTVNAYNDANSYPIAITLAYPPATDLTVNIVFTGNTAKLNATSITFAPGQTRGYMTLLVTNATSGTYDGTLSLTGTNKDSYTIATTMKVTVTAKPTTPTISDIVVAESSVSENAATISVTGGADGTAYVSLKCSQTSTGYLQYHTLAEMKA